MTITIGLTDSLTALLGFGVLLAAAWLLLLTLPSRNNKGD
jgi:hypothetical protein